MTKIFVCEKKLTRRAIRTNLDALTASVLAMHDGSLSASKIDELKRATAVIAYWFVTHNIPIRWVKEKGYRIVGNEFASRLIPEDHELWYIELNELYAEVRDKWIRIASSDPMKLRIQQLQTWLESEGYTVRRMDAFYLEDVDD